MRAVTRSALLTVLAFSFAVLASAQGGDGGNSGVNESTTIGIGSTSGGSVTTLGERGSTSGTSVTSVTSGTIVTSATSATSGTNGTSETTIKNGGSTSGTGSTQIPVHHRVSGVDGIHRNNPSKIFTPLACLLIIPLMSGF